MTAHESKAWRNESLKYSMIISGPIPFGKIIEGMGYINLPWFHSGNQVICTRFAGTLQSILKSLDTYKLKGWIIF